MPAAPAVTAITGGHVLDVRAGEFHRRDVAIEGERIVGLPLPGSLAAARPVFDATGMFLLPGLIDCHVHLVMRGEDVDPSASAGRSDDEIAAAAAEAAERTLLGGVTTVRDLGGWNHVEMSLRDDIEAGVRPGPRLILAGRLLSRPTPAVRYYPGMYQVVTGADQVRDAARAELERGARVIKVMATGAMLSPEEEDAGDMQLGREEIRAAVETAAQAGAHVAAHAHAREGIRQAVEAGVGSIEHGTYADEQICRRMADRDVFLVPTLSASSAMLADERAAREIPAHLRRRLVESQDVHVAAVRMAHRSGVPIAMGTDAGTPGNHHGRNAQECIEMVKAAGMDPLDSVRSATVLAARLLRREADIGSLEPGRFADMIGLHANPLADIRALARVSLVMKGGLVYRGPPSLTERTR